MRHELIPLEYRHPVHRWEVANAAGLSLLATTAADIGQIARQLDTGAFHILASQAPLVWTQLAASSSISAILLNTVNAVTAVSGGRVVILEASGVSYADSSILAHAGKVVGITTGAASIGTPATYQSVGPMVDGTWSWTPGADIFLGLNGFLTESVPATGFLQRVGHAPSPTSININLGDFILL